MVRYLVHATEAEALASAAAIDRRARAVFLAQGYTLRDDGAVIGKVLGVDNPAGVTVTWDVPRQRLTDGAWILEHPETHPSAGFLVSPGVTVLQFVTQDVLAVPVEDADPSWFPVPPEF